MKTCFTFSGQGSQINRMGERLLGYASARRVFDEARKVLEDRVVDLAIYGKRRDMLGVVDSQLTMVLVNCAYYDVLREVGEDCDVVVPHSLGAYSGLYAAGFLGLGDTLASVEARAQAMKDCVPEREEGESYMAAVIGCDLKRVMSYVKGKPDIYLANINSVVLGKSQFVVSGLPYAIALAGEHFSKIADVEYHPLWRIPGPFHCEIMDAASTSMEVFLGNVVMAEPKKGVKYISDCSGKIIRSSGKIKEDLAKQVSSGINFVRAIDKAKKLGCRRFVECGPRRVLSDLVDGSDVEVLTGDELLFKN